MSNSNSSTKWTKQQLEAIEERNSNLLVAAAAGSGKTAVLVERIIQRITDKDNPIDIDRLLIVTFTNAAAAQMRERIATALTKKIDEGIDIKYLQRQLTLLNKANITTIHSFCLDIIRKNFHCVDIDPGFRIADETEVVLLKLESLEELFESMYEEENKSEEFLKLVECYCGNRNDQFLQDIVLNIYEFIQSNPLPERWLVDNAKKFHIEEGQDFINTEWAETILIELRIQIRGMRDILVEALAQIKESEGLEPYFEALQKDLLTLDDLLLSIENKKATWDSVYNSFIQITFDRLKRCGKNADIVKKEQVKAIRDEVKLKLKKIREDFIYADNKEMIEEISYMKPILESLGQLVMEFQKRYSIKKKDKGLVDFNDLEHFCLKILIEVDEKNIIKPTDTAIQLKKHYEEIYIDEYQDSNEVQEVLLNAISRSDIDEPNLFMVGDIKQSIYRFRQAKPELFNNKYKLYSLETGEKNRKILLNKNFRSRSEVLEATNYLFGMLMSPVVGEIDYNDEAKLYTGANFGEVEKDNVITGGAVEINIIDMKKQEKISNIDEEDELDNIEEEQINEEELDSVQLEAKLIADRIKQLMTVTKDSIFKVFDNESGKYRKVRYKDIVILLRATKNWAEVFYEELSNEGIPVFADTSGGYFKTTEISTIMSLLQIIDNPIQDIPLLAVLKSPIGYFYAEELIDIRLCDKEVPFYEAMKKAVGLEGELGEKVKGFLTRLEAFRAKAIYMKTDELLWYLYTDTGYYSFVSAMAGGVQRQANLRMLFERARQYENTSYKGLFNFINFMNKLKSSNGDMGSAKIIGENEDVVRIMSIHKSKGLEFPIVFVSGTGKKFNMMDLNKSILLHQAMGYGPDYVSEERRISYASIAKQSIRQKVKLESLSEEMRILYVAMTRAKEKLIITGTAKDIKRLSLNWRWQEKSSDEKISEYQVLKGKSYLDWICTATIKHSDAIGLREYCEIDETDNNKGVITDKSSWEIKIWKREDFVKSKEEIKEEHQDFLEEFGQMEFIDETIEYSDKGKRLLEQLEWEYPYKEAEKIPVKLTVTELKRLFNTELGEESTIYNIDNTSYVPTIIKKPAFLEQNTDMTAVEKGTVLHFVMQHLKLNNVNSKQAIHEQLNHMVTKELLTRKDIESVNINKILDFFSSQLGKRMLKSKNMYREIPFTMNLNSCEVFKELEHDKYKNQNILLQGVIDCCFVENESIIIIDYKTDYVTKDNIDNIKNKYKIQIDYYAKALEQITPYKVSEKYIYLFWNGSIIQY